MNDKNIIKTSRDLNHFRGGYTRLELDFIYAFISTIKDEDTEFKLYSLTLKDLENKLQRRLQLKDIEYMFDSLISKSFKVKNNKKLAVYSFFTRLEFDYHLSKLTVKFNEDLKPHLIQLSSFAKGNFKYLLQFKSEYSKRLYMLMSQWAKAGKKTYTVEELREILAVPKSYLYADFKRKILQVAEAEFIKNSDIYFTFEPIKEGKRVDKLIFRIYTNRHKESQQGTLEDTNLSEELKIYIGKKIYQQGYDWIIKSISKNDKNEYSILGVEVDDKDYVKTFNISAAQLSTAK